MSHECSESNKRYSVSAEGKARLIPCCPDCGELTEDQPIEASVCQNDGGCVGCCSARCIILPDGGVWGVTLEKAKRHLAKKMCIQAAEEFKVACGPKYKEVESLRQKMQRPSFLGAVLGIVTGLIIWFVPSSIILQTKPDEFVVGGILFFVVSLFFMHWIHLFVWRIRGRRISAKLERLGFPVHSLYYKQEDYLDQVKIELVNGEGE